MKNPVRAMMYFLPSDDLKTRVMIFMYTQKPGRQGGPGGASAESNGKSLQVKESELVLSRRYLIS
jgi:hypothetical protein